VASTPSVLIQAGGQGGPATGRFLPGELGYDFNFAPFLAGVFA
jgi:hypothetical protein